MGKIDYWDSEYPTYIEIPKDYWVCSYNVQYTQRKKNENSDSRKS